MKSRKERRKIQKALYLDAVGTVGGLLLYREYEIPSIDTQRCRENK